MKNYEYQGVRESGEKIHGFIKAEQEEMALQILRESNVIPLQINRSWYQGRGWLQYNFGSNTSWQILFCKQMSILLQAGVTISDSLAIMKSNSKPKEQATVIALQQGLASGYTLADSMELEKKSFSHFIITMTSIGEATGELGGIFARIATMLEKNHGIKEKFQLTMMYPLFLTVMSFLLIIFLLHTVIPVLASIFDTFQSELPWTTQLLMEVSSYLLNHGREMTVGTVMLTLAVVYAYRQPKARMMWDKFYLRMPLLGKMLLRSENAIFFSTLAMIIESGITVSKGMDLLGDLSTNQYIRRCYKNVAKKLNQGNNLSMCMSNVEIFPQETVLMLQTGEKSGELAVMLNYAAQKCEGEALGIAKRLEVLAEPVIIVCLGCFIGFVIMSTIMPIMDLMVVVS